MGTCRLVKEAHQKGFPILNCSSFATLILAKKDEMLAKHKIEKIFNTVEHPGRIKSKLNTYCILNKENINKLKQKWNHMRYSKLY